jgi:hypothetical protein
MTSVNYATAKATVSSWGIEPSNVDTLKKGTTNNGYHKGSKRISKVPR